MTTATMVTHGRAADPETTGHRPNLEDLVDRVFAALFKEEPETSERSAMRTIHQARRLRQAGDVDGALTGLSCMDMAKATPGEVRWAYAEWEGLAKRQFGGLGALVYRQGTGRAAVLVPRDGGTLEVLAVLGMRWRAGKVVSRRSLRSLQPL